MNIEKVPYYFWKREYEEHREEYLQICDQVLTSGNVLQSKEVHDLEVLIATESRRKYSAMVGSCTDGLFFSLKSLGIGKGDEVLVPNISFVATIGAIIRCGAIPVCIDTHEDGNINFDKASLSVGEKTKAMIFVHLYGKLVDPNVVTSFLNAHDIAIVEDAAQAFGVKRNGISAGSYGTISCFSFDPTKIIAAAGSGGAVLTDDAPLLDSIKRLRYHGFDRDRNWVQEGGNSNLSAINAALLISKIKKNKKWKIRRQEIATYYNENLRNVKILPAVKFEEHSYHKYVIKVQNRDTFMKSLIEKGVECKIHYNRTLYDMVVGKTEVQKHDNLPKSRQMCKEVVSLPMHPYLSDSEIQYVTEVCNASV